MSLQPCEKNPIRSVVDFNFDDIDGIIEKIIMNANSFVILTSARQIYNCVRAGPKVNDVTEFIDKNLNLSINNIFNVSCGSPHKMLILDTNGKLWHYKDENSSLSMVQFNRDIFVKDIDVYNRVLLDSDGILYQYNLACGVLRILNSDNHFTSMCYTIDDILLLNTNGELFQLKLLDLVKIDHNFAIQYYNNYTWQGHYSIIISDVNNDIYLRNGDFWYLQENFWTDYIIDIIYFDDVVIVTKFHSYFCKIQTVDNLPSLELTNRINNYAASSNIKSAYKV